MDELSKVVTRYGIIDQGEMIEEISAKDLQEKCKQKLIIEVDDLKKATDIISSIVQSKNISVISDNQIEIQNDIDKASKINNELVKGGINVSAIYPNSDSLEEYFIKRIGG